jgi:UDP-N-acetylmuramoyl-L-alanyl-D-glutamate--2,6-diaminopimelate ligase
MIGYLTQDYALIHAFGVKTKARTSRETKALKSFIARAPKLSDYLSEDEVLAVKGNLDCPISGLAVDSRRVVAGNIFFAVPGVATNALAHIDEAMSRGAVAIVTATMPKVIPSKITLLHVKNVRESLARVAQRYYKSPDKSLRVVGVTGTSGKTTVSYLLRSFLNANERVGMISSVSYDLGARSVPAFKTTPEALDIYGMMAQMRDSGCRSAVLEVSSHGLDQERVLGLQFSVAVFTNLSEDHLDYHGSMEEYFRVKSGLFVGKLGYTPSVAVVNVDDLYGKRLADIISTEAPQVRLVTTGLGAHAAVRAEKLVYSATTTRGVITWPRADGGRNEVAFKSPLIGEYNVANLLSATATAWSMDRDPSIFIKRLKHFESVPGRMQRIDAGQSYSVFVDSAHTDDALRNALGMLRPITSGRLLVVFGCSGNKNRSKRPLMVKSVQEFADFSFATADNPRGEAVEHIFSDMKTGATSESRIAWVEDRRRAISVALDVAKEGDTILIAGKGHESYQELSGTMIPWDDRQIARELIAEKQLRN